MNFGQAIEHLKAGRRVARAGWNGKGMWLELQRPDENSKMSCPYVYLFTADQKVVPWTVSQTDMLAEDWADCSIAGLHYVLDCAKGLHVQQVGDKGACVNEDCGVELVKCEACGKPTDADAATSDPDEGGYFCDKCYGFENGPAAVSS